MTAGSDGVMHFWDYEAKNKIKSFSYAGIPLCHARVSPTGDMVAYGLGNDWHIGSEGSKWTPKIGVHIIPESETKYSKWFTTLYLLYQSKHNPYCRSNQ